MPKAYFTHRQVYFIGTATLWRGAFRLLFLLERPFAVLEDLHLAGQTGTPGSQGDPAA